MFLVYLYNNCTDAKRMYEKYDNLYKLVSLIPQLTMRIQMNSRQ